jgi:hypothetical protein
MSIYDEIPVPELHTIHRYLISRLPLQGFYLWRHVLSTAPPFILWWSNLEILFVPLHRSFCFIRRLRWQPIQKEHSRYSRQNTNISLYTVRCLWYYTVLYLGLSSLKEIGLFSMKRLLYCKFLFFNGENSEEIGLFSMKELLYVQCTVQYREVDLDFFTTL